MQALQDEAGTGPGSTGPVWGRHRPIAAMYVAARVARGAGDKSAISSAGYTTRPIPMDNISDDIRCSDVTNCDRIWRLDNIMPASLCASWLLPPAPAPLPDDPPKTSANGTRGKPTLAHRWTPGTADDGVADQMPNSYQRLPAHYTK